MSKKYLSLILIIIVCFAKNCLSQVIYNAYAKVTAVTNSTLLTVNNVNQTNHTFNTGEYVIVMQMQDNVIGTNTTNVSSFGSLSTIANAGRFEVARISAINSSAGTPTSIALTTALANTYNTGTNSSVQVITFRRLSATAFTSTANITGLAWNGNIGGVIAIEVGTTFTLLHAISANGIGFAGGQKNNPNYASTSCDATFVTSIGNKWAGKGEGIYKNTNTALAAARGKMINGGGGGTDENSGGGGGANYSAGGTGGPGYTGSSGGCNPGVGGQGGVALSTYINSSRVFMGGGGGAGHENNGLGSVGGNGGGIILLKAATLRTTGSCSGAAITANGTTAADSGNDGSGGGGAGGSIILQVNTFTVVSTCSVAIAADGGDGGSTTNPNTHSGGGGGGQGALIFSAAQPTANVTVKTTPGNGGESCSGCTGTVNATSGGGPANGGVISNSSGALPIELTYFGAEQKDELVSLTWKTAFEKNTSHFNIEKSLDAVNWEVIGTVKANGFSVYSQEYNFNDYDVEAGTTYYRLRIFDNDKTARFSGLQSVTFVITDTKPKLYPNPANDFIDLTWVGKDNDISIRFFEISGKEINIQKQNLSPKKIRFDVGSLNPGIYFLTIRQGQAESTTHKIIIQ